MNASEDPQCTLCQTDNAGVNNVLSHYKICKGDWEGGSAGKISDAEAWGLVLRPQKKLGVTVYTCNHSSKEMKAGVLGFTGQPV